MRHITPFHHLSDRDLIDATARVATDERHLTAELLALLGELDARRLYLGQSCASLFTYCTQVLHFSEHAAYHRIEAARAVRQFPVILDMVAEGALTMTTVTLLAAAPDDGRITSPCSTPLVTRASVRSNSRLRVLRPGPTSDTIVRKLPTAGSDYAHPRWRHSRRSHPDSHPIRAVASRSPSECSSRCLALARHWRRCRRSDIS